MHLNADNSGGRTACSSGFFLHSHFLALLSLRGIEPRATFLWNSPSAGVGHSWWTPPTLLLRIRAQDYNSHVARSDTARGAHSMHHSVWGLRKEGRACLF